VKLYKLLAILRQLESWRVNMHGMIYPAYGGELTLAPMGQPEAHVHDYLIDKGFVEVDGDYIYRPRGKR
jgi:hypothetical protein